METNKETGFIRNNYMNIFIMIVTSLILGIIFYSMVVLPKEEARSKINMVIFRQSEMKQFKSDYFECLLSADNNYSINWDSVCTVLGKNKNCQIPLYRANSVNKTLKTEKATCLNLFKIQVNTKS